jgi:hypothetical protein
MQSALTLNALDYHSALLLYPPGSTKVFRDGGVQLRGFALDKRLHFRAGVFNGVRGEAGEIDPDTGQPVPPLNPSDSRRLAGTLRFNLAGAEEGFFLGGLLFGERPVISLGASAIYQKNAVRGPAGVSDYFGGCADVYADVPFGGDHELFVLAGYYNWQNGEGAPTTGHGFLSELSYRWRWFAPVLSHDRFDGKTGTADLRAWRAGLNLWIDKHTFNVKTEFSQTETGASPRRRVRAFTVQAQVLF